MLKTFIMPKLPGTDAQIVLDLKIKRLREKPSKNMKDVYSLLESLIAPYLKAEAFDNLMKRMNAKQQADILVSLIKLVTANKLEQEVEKVIDKEKSKSKTQLLGEVQDTMNLVITHKNKLLDVKDN